MLQIKAHFHSECGSLLFSGLRTRKTIGPFSPSYSRYSDNTRLKGKYLGIPYVCPPWHSDTWRRAQSLAEKKN